MHKRRTVSCLSLQLLLLLLLLQLQLRSSAAKPAPGPQSFKQLLEQEVLGAALESSEERDGGMEGWKDGGMEAPEKLPWDSSERSSAAARLLQELLRTSKRSSSRFKKGGGLRSCFGVRLERIGSFSGLGC